MTHQQTTKYDTTDAVSIGGVSSYMVQLITPRVPAIAVSTVISSLRISFQLIRIGFRVKG